MLMAYKLFLHVRAKFSRCSKRKRTRKTKKHIGHISNQLGQGTGKKARRRKKRSLAAFEKPLERVT